LLFQRRSDLARKRVLQLELFEYLLVFSEQLLVFGEQLLVRRGLVWKQQRWRW
jgi:hypothetical protein